MDRDAFLDRIAASVGRRRGGAVPPPPELAPMVRRVDRETDRRALTDRFLREVDAVGGKTMRVPAGILPATITAALVEREVTRVSTDIPVERFGMREACERVGITVVPAEESVGVEVGLTTVTAAVAETGSVLVDAKAGSPRGTSLLPPIHLCVVLESQIVPDLIDALTLPDELPSSRVWITGPSKTADIEGILITGVHGPAEWWVAVAEGV